MNTAPSEQFSLAVRRLREQALAAGQRRLLVLAGERGWGQAAAERALATAGIEDAPWLSDQGPEALRLSREQAHGELGRELGGLVFDAWAGFDPDAFGLLSGALSAGGLLILLCPPLAAWPEYPDPDRARLAVLPWRPEQLAGRFVARLVRVIREDPHVLVIEQDKPVAHPKPPGDPPRRRGAWPRMPLSRSVLEPAPLRPEAVLAGSVEPWAAACRTPDQWQAVEALLAVCRGRARRPLVLLADRGRGKSAAFGIAAAELLRTGVERILVSGPRINAVDAVFRHAAQGLPGAQCRRGLLQWQGRELRYAAADAMVRETPPADLLLVDEAASLPEPTLLALLEYYPRLAFASTVHGYEGTGRGFELRFKPALQRLARDWRERRLETPVRWAPGDPLEAFTSQALLLAAEPPPAKTPDSERMRVERLDRDALLADEASLSGLFGLLVQAHYRTRPFDLRHLLDGPNLSVYVLRQEEVLLGTALVAAEGDLPENLVPEVLANRRRPQGHLVAQSLAAHLDLAEGARLRTARIIRIAVHPDLQGQGLGSALLAALPRALAAQGFDMLASSFGATAPLLRFWRRQALYPVRVGVKRAASSGAHSVMVLRGLSAAGERLAAQARGYLAAQLPTQLGDVLRELEPAIARELLYGLESPPADTHDRAQLQAFLAQRRAYEDVPGSLRRCALRALSQGSRGEAEAVVMKLLQGRPWEDVAQALGLPGRRGVLDALREELRMACFGQGD
ncbi:tRNA(Met) cytidine acetyltransferase TmcA [Alkalilimnicola sp. S0819]|uniref:tRNA(Met) cytidine acetyltransferase TmcA n=1 Tax=Alkalilimnicola sp. S0819 TaxID=2613922 RepID=UPI0012616BF2|nr:GNAT family N-acetyltransferase [Alkalilimnicola sp. S0819]KAB7622784.1 tRNA(Met) cytidine acetyltransferase [Alkalilimnicola sp. S0819]MPQ17280.1 GNAT family N-acetyltransferase [Alkalilimnicola sp. S0819]